MTEFLIVGRGLAASCLMHAFHRTGISFRTVGQPAMSSCSLVAAGIVNPVVFKRMTKSWLADKMLPVLRQFYRDAELQTGKVLYREKPIIRLFRQSQEAALWVARSKNELDDFLDPKIHPAADLPPGCVSAAGFGLVKHSGQLDVPLFLDTTAQLFSDRINTAVFQYGELIHSPSFWRYAGEDYRNVIFCEGWLLGKNPYFSWLPMSPVKGQVLDLEADFEPGSRILNAEVFLVQEAGRKFRSGATYEWEWLQEGPTEEGRRKLEAGLAKLLKLPYKVLDQRAGIRPASFDRRPLIGAHPRYKNMFVFNGLGTKGVMLCPYFANNFVNFYLQKEPLHKEVQLSRCLHLYDEKT